MEQAKRNPSFTPFAFANGVLYDYSNNQFPTKLHSWTGEIPQHFDNEESTYYGFVYSGLTNIQKGYQHHALTTGMFFAIKGPFRIIGGCGIVMERLNYKGYDVITGPVEKIGRLKYIDGCTDSLIISPPKKGDPCLNALFFPPGINQTQHTHPSMRVGIVFKGQGECLTPWGNIPLFPGQIFIIHEEGTPEYSEQLGKLVLSGTHSFRTFDDEMVVIAYHPDSDFGPEDENHPMINRTMVDGVSAANIDSIKTK